MRCRLLAAIAALALVSPTVGAQTICSEPLAPICTDMSLTAGAESESQHCIGDIETYELELTDYLACLNAKLDEAEQEIERMATLRDCLLEDGCDPATLEADELEN